MIKQIRNIFRFPELKRRVLFTCVLLIVYRIGAHVPTPGINGPALALFFQEQAGSFLGLLDLLSGGALRRLSVFALGIMPFIYASIILQLLTMATPALKKLQKEGERGRKKITQYARYGSVVLAAIQGLGIAVGLEKMQIGGSQCTMRSAGRGVSWMRGLPPIPLRVITAGVTPVIFSSSIFALPAIVAQFVKHPWAQVVKDWLQYAGWPYTIIYAAGIVFFTYFCTAAIFDPNDVAASMKKYGGYVPGIHPGVNTAEFIERILYRTTLVGALCLAGISILPKILNLPFYLGGTCLVIVVGVCLDTVQQVEAHLLMERYKGLPPPTEPNP